MRSEMKVAVFKLVDADHCEKLMEQWSLRDPSDVLFIYHYSMWRYRAYMILSFESFVSM